MKFKVTVTRYVAEYVEVEIDANNKENAEDQALGQYFDDEFNGIQPSYWKPAVWRGDSVEAYAEEVK